MLKVYYCEQCHRTLYLQFEKDITCRSCTNAMRKLNIAYEEFSLLGEDERKKVIEEQVGSI